MLVFVPLDKNGQKVEYHSFTKRLEGKANDFYIVTLMRCLVSYICIFKVKHQPHLILKVLYPISKVIIHSHVGFLFNLSKSRQKVGFYHLNNSQFCNCYPL